MRVIKFRGFHADEHGVTVIKLDGKEIRGLWIVGDLEQCDGLCWIEQQAVIPETVGQYVCDDEKGKEVFEGDIVSGYFDHKTITGHIFYGSNAKFFIYRKGLFGIELNNASVWINVIGNIFENSDLLEVEE